MKILVQLVLAASLLPYLLLNFRAFGFFGGLGANPIEAIIHDTGLWGIRLLIITLLLTPIYHYSNQEIFRRLPKPIGLIAFFYVLNHFLCYAIIDQSANLGVIVVDIIETPYLFEDWFNKNRSSMSGLVYTAAILGVWHYFWQEKVIGYEALIDTVLISLLILWRLRISVDKAKS